MWKKPYFLQEKCVIYSCFYMGFCEWIYFVDILEINIWNLMTEDNTLDIDKIELKFKK